MSSFIVSKKARSRQRLLLFLCVGIILLCYFFYHGIQGKRGYHRLVTVEQELKQTRATLEQWQEKNKTLQNRIFLLQDDHLDLDLLEERVRFMLGYTGENEAVIYLPKEED